MKPTMIICAALMLALMGCTTADTDDGPPLCAADDAAVCQVDQLGCQQTAKGPACMRCDAGAFADKDGSCAPLGGEALRHAFPDNSVEAGGEIVGMCRSWTLNNDEPLYVNAVQLENTELSHHSNWMFVPDDLYDGPDGLWPCEERGYSQLSAALSGGVVYAQSTQATKEVQKFPDGVVVRIPARARIISDVHVLNVTTQPNTGHVTLTLYAVPEPEVSVVLTPFHVSYDGLEIPPMSTSRFEGECELNSHYVDAMGQPFDMEVYYILPHTHALGTRMFVEAMGGEHDGMSLVDVHGFNGEARGKQFDPPLSISGAAGLRFGCEFNNPRAETVYWGFDDQEMCEALGFAATPMAFEARIEHAQENGIDGQIKKFTGPCGTIAFPWDPHTKGQ